MQTPDSSDTCTQTFHDRHIHGIAGVDFATSNSDQIRAALTLLRDRRTTQVTASLPSLHTEYLWAALTRLQSLHAQGLLAGVHLEGPFIAPEYAGAHPHEALLVPDSTAGRALLEQLLQLQTETSLVTMMTVAPELPGFEDLVQQLMTHGITPAFGHTGATYDQMRAAITHIYELTGQAVMITHLYNAMRGFHHRDPGPLLAVVEAADSGRVVVELIADGHHVDLNLIRWWFHHYPTAVRLVSDASAATGIAGQAPLAAGPPRLGHQVLQSAGPAGPRLEGQDTLASGGKDLLSIHDGLVAGGFDHDMVCGAMQ